MGFSPSRKVKELLSSAIDWRFRDRLEAERIATVELGRTFIEEAVAMADRQREIDQRPVDLENRVKKLEEEK